MGVALAVSVTGRVSGSGRSTLTVAVTEEASDVNSGSGSGRNNGGSAGNDR